MEIISCNNAVMVPKECHNTGARSGKVSRFLLSSNKAASRCEKLRAGKNRETAELDMTRWKLAEISRYGKLPGHVWLIAR